MVCAALSGASALPALAAPPRGTLTSHEYTVLSSGEAKYTAALKRINWDAAFAACRAVGSSTDLLKGERDSCLTETRLLKGLANFPRHESNCGTAEPHKDLCLVPLYVGLTNNAKAMYQADMVERRVAAQRGFTGRCLDVLGNTSRQLEQQRALANATEKLTNDVRTGAEIVEGKLPSNAINVSKVDSDAKAFERDANLVLAQTGPKLSACPHQ